MESKLVYKLHDRPPVFVSLLYAVQWFIFTFASSIVIPVVIGHAFGFSPIENAAFIQRSFLLIGVASLLQVFFGHRYPIIEGPAGMWWGIFLILVNLGPALHKTPVEIARSLEMGLIIAGIILVLLGVTGVISKIQSFFTPIITGSYMILLAISMSGSFIKGILGVGYHGNSIKIVPTLISIILISFLILLSNLNKPILRSFSILIGIVIGWAIYSLLGLADTPQMAGVSVFALPRLFAFGPPVFDTGVIITSIITGFVLISNIITSVSVMITAAEGTPHKKTFSNGGIITGVTHILSGIGATVGMIPLSIAASMVEITGIAAIFPFVIAMMMIILLGLMPLIGMFFAALPAPVGYAVLFTTFTQLLSFGFREYNKITLNTRNLTVISLSLMLGTGVMFIPKEVLATVNPILSYLLGNGLLIGVIFSMVLEHIIYKKR